VTQSPGEAVAADAGEVFDLGYQGYEGERHGRWQARRAIWRDGVRTTLGLGRGIAKKVAPVVFIGLMWLPAVIVIVITGFVSTFGGDTTDIEGPTFAEYYDWAFIFALLFSAVVAPELLCPDRAQDVLTLYLVRPVTSTDYVAARWLAFLTVMAFALWFPELLIFGWNALSARDPVDWLSDNWDEVPRFLAAGGLLAIFFTTLALTASAFTTRRPYAAIATIAIVAISAAVGSIGADAFSGNVGEWSTLINLILVPLSVSDWIFDVQGEGPLADRVYIIWLTALISGVGALLWSRYRSLGR
jgi:ABC-2 type transport system permease protein